MRKLKLFIFRIGAYVFDYCIYYGFVFLLGKYGVWGYLASIILFFIYRYATTAATGKTLGMHLMKLSLDRYDWFICLKREIARFASAFYFIGYLYGIFDKEGRTFHDLFSDTLVGYQVSDKPEENRVAKATDQSSEKLSQRALESTTEIRSNKIADKYLEKKHKYIQGAVCILLFVSVAKWVSGFILNDIGNIGLKRTLISKEYFQSFDGDNLLSLSQQELYLQTLGRRYTAVIDIDRKPTLVRLSNKLTYSEIYKMDIQNASIKGSLLYSVAVPFQYICSGNFHKKTEIELCGISPIKQIVLVDKKGKIYAQVKANISNIISVKSGDIDKDEKAEIILLSRNGEIEIIKYIRGKLESVFNNKISDDVNVDAFYLNNGLTIVSNGEKRSTLYDYSFSNNKFILQNEKNIDVAETGNIESFGGDILISYVRRNNMTFKVGNVQRFELYEKGNERKRIANFGARPSRSYDFKVRNLEEIVDIDGDGETELILKAVGKQDVMGQKYRLEIYKIDKTMLKLNRVLTKMEGLLNLEL
jgi:uncharacterized RDD family membrane protein YckC